MRSRGVLALVFLALVVVAAALPAFAQTGPTLDPSTVQTAIIDQATAMKAVVLAILALVLAIAAGRALFKRFAKA
jgi:hypothetical protein